MEDDEELSSCAVEDVVESPVTFQLQLKRIVESRDLNDDTLADWTVVSITHKTVSFSSLPKTGLAVKQCLERDLSIPVCVQRLSFGSTLIKDAQPLKRMRLRDTDQLTLEFPSHAKISVINDVLRLMEEIRVVLDRVSDFFAQLPPEEYKLTPEMDSLVQMIVDPMTVESLVYMFSPASEALPQTNRLYFVHNGGVELAMRLHGQLVALPWTKLTIEMQYLEHALLRILWDLSSTLGVRYLLLDFPVLEQASKSLMRVEVSPHKWVKPPEVQNAAAHTNEQTQRYILGETMYKAMGVMTK